MGLFDVVRSLFGDEKSEEYGPFNLPPRDRVDVTRRARLIHTNYDVDEAEAEEIARILANHLNSSQYNPRDVISEIKSSTDMPPDSVEPLVQQQIRSVQFEDSVRRYQQSGVDVKVEWMLPGDGDVSPVCKDASDQIDSRGGAVTIEELNHILRGCAEKYPDGTPELMDFWIPHEGNCRCTISPVVV